MQASDVLDDRARRKSGASVQLADSLPSGPTQGCKDLLVASRHGWELNGGGGIRPLAQALVFACIT